MDIKRTHLHGTQGARPSRPPTGVAEEVFRRSQKINEEAGNKFKQLERTHNLQYSPKSLADRAEWEKSNTSSSSNLFGRII